MITASDVKLWNRYHDHEGPVYYGSIKIPEAPKDAPFDQKVLSLTALAEGGHADACQMWDSGLLSVGAIQFIDRAPQLSVCDMLGHVAERAGIGPVVDALRPALDLSGAMFFRAADGRWRFSLGGSVVESISQQNVLYFGDLRGNALGSFDDAKRKRAKTWVACLVNVWQIPGAVEAQAEFTLPRLMSSFVWGQLKADLFAGDQPEEGIVGATRAILLSYCVNAPAVVVNRYARAVKDAALQAKGSHFWCMMVLRGVIVGSGVDVWPNRWRAEAPAASMMFGAELPSYEDLVAGLFPKPPPNPVVQVLPEAEPDIPVFFAPEQEPLEREQPDPPAVWNGSPWYAILKSVLETLARLFRR